MPAVTQTTMTSRKRRPRLPTLLLALPLVAGCGGSVAYEMHATDTRQPAWQPASTTFRDRLAEVGLPLISDDDTVYAPGFGEKAFDTLTLGCSQQDVVRKLGPPLAERRWQEHLIWYYSQHGGKSKSFHLRLVEFDLAGNVVGSLKTFLLD